MTRREGFVEFATDWVKQACVALLLCTLFDPTLAWWPVVAESPLALALPSLVSTLFFRRLRRQLREGIAEAGGHGSELADKRLRLAAGVLLGVVLCGGAALKWYLSGL